MAKSILLTASGRERLLGPLVALSYGQRTPEEVVDKAYWGIESGILPDARRLEMRTQADRFLCEGPSHEVLKGLRLCWDYVELVGCDLFCSPKCSIPTADNSLSCLRRGRSPREGRRPGECVESWQRAADLFFEALADHRKVLESLVEANIRLVVKWARKYARAGPAEEMDLLQEGCEGLIAAARRYDYYRGFRFSTYAIWWIRQAIIRALLQHSRLIRIPVHALGRLGELHRYVQEVFEKTGDYPTQEEAARIVGVDTEELHCLQKASQDPISIDRLLGEDESVSMSELIDGLAAPPEAAALEADVRNRVLKALAILGPREREVLVLRYGLEGNEPRTLESIGRLFGVSRERIRQIESRALRKLRADMSLFAGEEV
jgi:RNA polymerase sigma factor (sigma-70 family)